VIEKSMTVFEIELDQDNRLNAGGQRGALLPADGWLTTSLLNSAFLKTGREARIKRPVSYDVVRDVLWPLPAFSMNRLARLQ
jgi:hypothetical protein